MVTEDGFSPNPQVVDFPSGTKVSAARGSIFIGLQLNERDEAVVQQFRAAVESLKNIDMTPRIQRGSRQRPREVRLNVPR